MSESDTMRDDVRFHMSPIQAAALWATVVVPILSGLIWLSVAVQSLRDDVAHITWRLDHATMTTEQALLK